LKKLFSKHIRYQTNMTDIDLTGDEPMLTPGTVLNHGHISLSEDSDESSKDVKNIVIKVEKPSEPKEEKKLADGKLSVNGGDKGLKEENADIKEKTEELETKANKVIEHKIKDETIKPKTEKMDEDVEVQITGAPLSGAEIKVDVKVEKSGKKKKDKKAKKERKKVKKERKKARKEAKKRKRELQALEKQNESKKKED